MKKLSPHFPALCIFLLLACATYRDISTHSFLVVWDDPLYVTDNPVIRALSWHNIQTAFSRTFVGNYAPVQIISYMFDYQLWGLNPAGFLLTNVCCHFLSAAALYLLLFRLGVRRWGAIFGAAVFLVHPVQIENVLWVSQRKSVLAMLFFLLALHSYLTYRENRGDSCRLWYAASLILHIFAVLSKPVAVIFPFALILYEQLYHPGERRIRDHADKVPYLLVSLAAGCATILIQSPEIDGGRIAYPPDFGRTLPITMLPVLVSYLKMIFWPDPSSLSALYGVRWTSSLDLKYAVPALTAVGLAAIALYLYRRRPKLFFWYALFFLGLLPVSQIIPLVTMMNDRYLYFPMIGIAGICAWGAGAACIRNLSALPRIATVFFFAGMLALLSSVSYQRSLVWRSTVTLFSDAAAKYPNLYGPWVGLAAGYRAQGDMESALRYYEIASRYGYLDADDAFAIARIYLDRKEPDKAYSYIWGGLLKSRTKEGFLLLGIYQGMRGNLDEAEKLLNMYIESSPDSAEGMAALANIHLMKGRLKQ